MALSETEELELLQLERDRSGGSNGPAANTHPPEQEPETQGLFRTSIGENSGWLKAARTPAKLSREGLKMITDKIPDAQNQSVGLNILHNTPKMLGEIGSELSASMLDPETLITEGAMKGLQAAAPYVAPPIKAAGRWLGSQAEKFSGLAHKTPGVLARATEDSGLMFGPGTAKVSDVYEGAKNLGNSIRPEFKALQQPQDVVLETLGALDSGGITDQEALYARKMLDQTKHKWADEFYQASREKLDHIAKQSFSGADSAYERAVRSEALRNAGSINKNGTTSVLRDAATLYKPLLAPAFSPIVQGGIATATGVGSKALGVAVDNPAMSGLLLDKYRGPKKEEKRGK